MTTLELGSKCDALSTINNNTGTSAVRTRATGVEGSKTTNVLGGSNSASGLGVLKRVPGILQSERSHPAWEHTRANSVDIDVLLGEGGGKHAREVEGGSLTWLVRVCSVPWGTEASLCIWRNGGSRGNVNDASRGDVVLALLEEVEERNSKVELRLDVECENLVPSCGFWEVGHRGTPSQARVVDEDVEAGLVLLDLLGQGITAGLGADVRLERDTLASGLLAELRELGGDALKIRELTRGDVDLCTVADVGCADHLSDSCCAASDKSNFALEAEESLDAELGHDFGGCVLWHLA